MAFKFKKIIDNQSRIVIPSELLVEANIQKGEEVILDLSTAGAIIIKKIKVSNKTANDN